MKSYKTKKRGIDKPLVIAVSFVSLLLALPVLLYVLQQKQTLQQHAQMTPPPAPPNCHYIPNNCSATPTCDMKDPSCHFTPCDPGAQQMICSYSLSPTPDRSNTYSEQ